VRVALEAAFGHCNRVHIGSRYRRILQAQNIRRAQDAEISGSLSDERKSQINQQDRNVGPTVRSIALCLAVVLFAGIPAMGATMSLARVGGNSRQSDLDQTGEMLPVNIELAHDLSRAINSDDVDQVVELFTEEDAGPTLVADRFAWQKFEIRLWALQQASMNIDVDADGYQLTANGATWDATVYRDDWAAVGVHGLSVMNSISVHNGKIATFTSIPRNATDVQQLGNLWRPGATPEH
jgi:hypothetical protein